MTLTQHTDNQAALAILNATGVPVLEAAILAKDALAANRGSIKRARRCLAASAEALRQQERTVSFEQAVAAALEARKDRRIRTGYDFRYFTRLFMNRCAGWRGGGCAASLRRNARNTLKPPLIRRGSDRKRA